ncbi:Serine/threonine-protein kinase MRCK gamma [Schistosoma japonicum]|uniref:non-specific serine/threonine protein kinase n=3 Tax=Schistosoma japonicum TaxID=6182 RepID=A0A4Z2DV54_SCHJA|nr:Serine/threonine-protein kinase MRCK gamma [Schistosoma japonicum]TNN20453.1 Serine/threonine-protein kinase MRCK gamma [Schistosoma japonicum]TNN20454.1 Serine/threonine-protein kinase MRCK gamma [Schistosoma japonicum]
MRTLNDRINELVSLYTKSSPLLDDNSVSIEYLLDTVVCLFYECKLPQHKNEKNCIKFYNAVKKYVDKIESCWISKSEFETIRLIGSGAFGDVSVVKWKNDGKIYALKSLHKYDMLKRSDRACFQEERDVMVKAMVSDSPWLAKLHHTFQDEKFLYFLMDFYNGGDMLTMLSKFDDKIPESIAQFYVSEMVLAINALHQLGYVHRDIKPDNVLLQSSGHIVLADFGSCLKLGENGLVKNNTAVGTPDYISPEILRASEDGHGTYGVECDYWSLGVVMYEMLFGETPFYSENLIETYGHIMNFEKHFTIPTDCVNISESACDLMRHLICDRKRRFGRNGIDELKEHPFFKGIDWEHIREQNPPYIPEVTSPDDTSNFDIEQSSRNHEGPPLGPIFRGCQVACIGFTFTNNSPLNELGPTHYRMMSESKVEYPVDNSKSQTSDSHVLNDNDSPFPCDNREIYSSNSKTFERGADKLALTDLLETMRTKCAAYEKEISELKDTLSCYHETKWNNVSANSVLNPTVCNVEKQAVPSDDTSTVNSLVQQVEVLNHKLKESEAQNHIISTTLDSLRNELHEQHALREKLQSEVQAFEEENESLCKRAADAQLAIRLLESEHNELLSELTRLRGELSSHRDYSNYTVLDDVHNLVKNNESGRLANGIKYHSISASSSSSSSSTNLVNGTQHSLTNNHSSDPDLQERLRESDAKLKRVMETLIAVKHEAQNLKLGWQSEQKEWMKERELLETKIKTFINQKTIALEGELTALKENNAELENNIANWERHLFELNQWVDDEREAKEKLHNFTMRLVSELDALRASGVVHECNQDGASQNGYHSWHLSDNLAYDSPAQSVVGENTLDWRQRKSTKLNKMERWSHEVALNNEVRAREQAELRLQEVESRLKEMYDQTNQKDLKIKEQDRIIEHLNDQLLELSSQARLCRINNDAVNDASNFIPKATLENRSMDNRRSLPSLDVDRPYTSTPGQQSSWTTLDASVTSQTSTSTHKFTFATFLQPTKCHVCGSLILGQKWQGVQCQDCQLQCHHRCCMSVHTVCPAPSFSSADGACGFGSDFESDVKMPKLGGIKRGWMKYRVYLSDKRLFFYDVISESSNIQVLGGSANSLYPSFQNFNRSNNHNVSLNSLNVSTNSVFQSSSPSRIVDLRSSGFSVSHVTASDVIHAKQQDIPKILKIIADDCLPSAPLFLLFESSTLCERWFKLMQDVLKLVQRHINTDSEYQCLQVREVSVSALSTVLKQINCASVLDEHRFLAGTDEGLYIVDIQQNLITRVGTRKPVYQVEALAEELQLVVAIQGKQRFLKLILVGSFEGMNLKPIKITEPKLCTRFTCSMSRNNTVCIICVASNRSLFIFEIARVQGRHKRLKEISCPYIVQSINFVRDGDWICVGSSNYFAMFSIWTDGPSQVLLRGDLIDLDSSLAFFHHSPSDAHCAVQLGDDEFLLAFENCGVYMNSSRKRTRPDNLMWPAKLISGTAVSFSYPYLYVFTEAGLVVFNAVTGCWVSTLSSCRLQPLSMDAHLCLAHLSSVSFSNSSRKSAFGNIADSSTSNTTPASPGISNDLITSQQQLLRLIYLPQTFDCKELFKQQVSALRSRRLQTPQSSIFGVTGRMRKSNRFNLYSLVEDGFSRTTHGISPERLKNFRSQSQHRTPQPSGQSNYQQTRRVVLRLVCHILFQPLQTFVIFHTWDHS